jgi:hypothetical protein
MRKRKESGAPSERSEVSKNVEQGVKGMSNSFPTALAFSNRKDGKSWHKYGTCNCCSVTFEEYQ